MSLTHHLPDTERELSDYGLEKMRTLIDLYSVVQMVQFNGQEDVSQPDIEAEETVGVETLQRVLFVQYKTSSLQQVLSRLIVHSDIAAAFPNLSKLAAILELLPVTTATVERTFSSMKVIKTRLCSRMNEDTLEHTMRICMEGPNHLSNDTLEVVVDRYKHM